MTISVTHSKAELKEQGFLIDNGTKIRDVNEITEIEVCVRMCVMEG